MDFTRTVDRGDTAYTPPAGGRAGLSFAFGTVFGTTLGIALGTPNHWQEVFTTQALANGLIGGTVVGVLALIAGALLDSLDYRGRLRRKRLLKAALVGGAISALPGLAFLPLLILVVPVGILSAWLAAVWSAPLLPSFLGEQFLPLRRRWAWYFLTGVLFVLAPSLLLLALSWGYRP